MGPTKTGGRLWLADSGVLAIVGRRLGVGAVSRRVGTNEIRVGARERPVFPPLAASVAPLSSGGDSDILE